MVKAKNIYVSIIVVIAVSCIAMGVQRLKFYSDSKKIQKKYEAECALIMNPVFPDSLKSEIPVLYGQKNIILCKIGCTLEIFSEHPYKGNRIFYISEYEIKDTVLYNQLKSNAQRSAILCVNGSANTISALDYSTQYKDILSDLSTDSYIVPEQLKELLNWKSPDMFNYRPYYEDIYYFHRGFKALIQNKLEDDYYKFLQSKGVESGYSSGSAFDDKNHRIFYWLEMW